MYRVMIVDDEEGPREGVAALIRQHCPRWQVSALAKDGREALELARHVLPDAVITDISMPHMNGLELLENLQGILPEGKLLVLSGYDQFEYAVQALRMGVSDYLLKPLTTQELIRVMDRLADELDEQAKHWVRTKYLRSQAEKADVLELVTYFRGALRGTELPALSPKMAEYAKGGSYCCVLCTGLEGRLELLEDLLEMYLGSAIRWVLLRLEPPGELGIVLWSLPGDRADFFLDMNHTLASIAVHCRRSHSLELRFFIGCMTQTPEKLKHSYKNSLQACVYTFPEQSEPVTTYKDVLEMSLMPCPPIPERLQRDIPAAVKCGNKAAFFEGSRELFGWFSQEGIRDATYIRMCILSLCYGILQICREDTQVSYFEFTNFQKEVMAAQSLEELQGHFINFAQIRWLRQQDARPAQRKLADRVAEFVELHLSDIDFSLDDVAAALFISPNYLRQLFKQETGQTFTEFLTARRMQRAKLLLGNPKLRISDAAEQCGYADSRYFSVCFKKYWRMTPSEYQASVAEPERP